MPLAPGIPDNFHDEFQAWVRIEPVARSDELAGGVAARTADPLWMLGRQWQTGELMGEDAGSPIRAVLDYSTQAVTNVRLGLTEPTTPLPPAPLEIAVEREWRGLDWRQRVQMGQHLERLIRDRIPAVAEDVITDLRSTHGLSLPAGGALTKVDEPTRCFIRFMQGRAIDGVRVLRQANSGALVRPAAIADPDWTAILDALRERRGALGSEPPDGVPAAWRNRRLDYRFELNPPDGLDPSDQPTHLVAPEYRSGALDWDSFDSASDVRGRWDAGSRTVYPTRLSAGGTSPRWWAFEDAATNFGALDVATPDLAKLLLMEFVLIYGDDWFSIPLTAKAAGLVRIDQLQVFNVFGDEPIIESVRTVTRDAVAGAGGDPDDPLLRWEVFGLAPYRSDQTGAAALGDVLFLPPVCGAREESRPVEEIYVVRDEGANRVWAVEQTVPDGLGRRVNGFDAQRSRIERTRSDLGRRIEELQAKADAGAITPQEQTALDDARVALARLTPLPPAAGMARYRLATSVPENWIPFNPVQSHVLLGTTDPSIRLRRARMLRNIADAEPEPVPARTRFLSLDAPDPVFWIDEEVVPRAGLHLQLTAQRTRWIDGKTYVWLGRKVLTGRGEGASGLRFDVLLHRPKGGAS